MNEFIKNEVDLDVFTFFDFGHIAYACEVGATYTWVPLQVPASFFGVCRESSEIDVYNTFQVNTTQSLKYLLSNDYICASFDEPGQLPGEILLLTSKYLWKEKGSLDFS